MIPGFGRSEVVKKKPSCWVSFDRDPGTSPRDTGSLPPAAADTPPESRTGPPGMGRGDRTKKMGEQGEIGGSMGIIFSDIICNGDEMLLDEEI